MDNLETGYTLDQKMTKLLSIIPENRSGAEKTGLGQRLRGGRLWPFSYWLTFNDEFKTNVIIPAVFATQIPATRQNIIQGGLDALSDLRVSKRYLQRRGRRGITKILPARLYQ